MLDKKPKYGKTAFISIVLCSGLLLGVLLFIAQDNPQQPDTAPRQDMLEKSQFRGIPPQKLDGAKRAIAALLQACPNIPKYAAHGENLTVDYYPDGWEKTSAHLDVELDLDPDSLKALPQGLRDPQWGGHMEMGLSGGAKPGAIMEMPLPLWLCGQPVEEDILSGRKRDWSQGKQFLPLNEIARNSF